MIRGRKQRQQKIFVKGKLDIRKQQQIINLVQDTFQIKVVWKDFKNQEKDKQSEIRNVIPCLMKKFDLYLQLKNIQLKEIIQEIKQPYNLGHLKLIFNNNNYKDIQTHWINYLKEESESDINHDKKIIQKEYYQSGRVKLLELSIQSYEQNDSEPLKNFLTTQKKQQTQNQAQKNDDNTLDYMFDSTGILVEIDKIYFKQKY